MTAPAAPVLHGAPTRAQIVAEARSWVGVPVFHRGRTREGGVDCLGLIIAVGVTTGAADDPDEANQDWAEYSRLPDPEQLLAGLASVMIPIADAEADDGDVAVLAWGERLEPMHLAILATRDGRRMLIHADPRVKPPRVVEVTFAADWPDRVCGFWRFPRVAL